ncbi:MAG: metalloregulator ArsR/SmtB family transcription factor [Alphaproteobacteria bacterium]
MARQAVSDEAASQAADLFRMLGDPSRLRLMILCRHAEPSVGELAQALGLSESLVSHHLRLLRAARLVRARRAGRRVHYTLADAHVIRVIGDMLDHVAEANGVQERAVP